MIYAGKLTDLMPLTLETFTTHPKAKIYILHINNIALVLKIREMKFNARGNLASWFLAYVTSHAKTYTNGFPLNG